MLFHLLLSTLFISAVTADKNSSSKDPFEGGLQDLEIAPKVLTNVQYGNTRLSIWEHLDNKNRTPDKKQYFVMPLIMFLPDSVNCTFNLFSNKNFIKFNILMWNDDVSSAVLKHLTQITENLNLNSFQITTLPMEQIRLVWASSVGELTDSFGLNRQWKSYANQENAVSFFMGVKDAETCQKALQTVKESPSDSLGDALQLQYILHAAKASRKKLTIKGDHMTQTKLFAKLKSNVNENGDVYLRAEDMNQLAHETAQVVIMSSVSDADYVDSGDEISLSKLLQDQLTTFHTTATEMTTKMWESTFWQNEWARPDKVNTFLNTVIEKDGGTNHTTHVNDAEFQKAAAGNLKGSVASKFSFGGGASGSSTEKKHVSDDDLRQWLIDNEYQVNWTGEKFTVKPMDLYRMNAQQMSQREEIASTYVQIHDVEFTQSVQVSFPDQQHQSQSGIDSSNLNNRIDQLITAHRNDQNVVNISLNALKSLITEEINNSINALSTELQQSDQNYTKGITRLQTELETTKTWMLAAMAKLEQNTPPLCYNIEFQHGSSFTCPAGFVVKSCDCRYDNGGGDNNVKDGVKYNGQTCTCNGSISSINGGTYCNK